MIRFTSLLACLLLLALSCCTTVVEARLGGIRLTEEADSAATNEPKKEKGVGYVPTSIRGQKGSSTNTKDEDPAEVEEVDEEEVEEIRAVHPGHFGEGKGMSGSAFGDPSKFQESTLQKDQTREAQGALVTMNFHSTLEIDFFQGLGRQPTPEEVHTLLEKTTFFFRQLFAQEPSFSSFELSQIEPSYDETKDSDNFSVSFTSSVTLEQPTSSSEAEAEKAHKKSLKTIAGIVNRADYDLFIRDYIWMTPPLQKNEFYQTHHVVFTCHPIS